MSFFGGVAQGIAAGAGIARQRDQIGLQERGMALQERQLLDAQQRDLMTRAQERINSTFRVVGDLITGYRDQQVDTGGIGLYGEAIASIESAGSGNYTALGPVTDSGDRAYGRYQVMGANIPSWTREVFGEEMSPEEFLANPAAQEAVFAHKFGQYIEQTGSAADAASMWFTGRPLAAGGATASDINGVTGQQYVERFLDATKQLPMGQIERAISPIMRDIRELGQKAGIDTTYLENQARALIMATPSGLQRALNEGRTAGITAGATRLAEAETLAPVVGADRALATAGVAAAPVAPTTSNITEWRAAVADGSFSGGLADWMARQAEASASRNTVNINGDTIPPALIDEAIKANSSADMAESLVEELTVFRELAATAQTGALTQVTLPIQQLFKQIGIDIGGVGEQVPILETLRTQQNQMALRLRNPASGFGLTGSASDRDVQFLLDSVASLGNTPQANQAILTILAAKTRRQSQLDRLRADYIFEKGSLAGWGDARREFVDANPFFTPEEQATIQGLSAGVDIPAGAPAAPAAAAPAAASPPSQYTPEQEMQMLQTYGTLLKSGQLDAATVAQDMQAAGLDPSRVQVNPQTGEVIYFDGTRWVPVP